MFTESHVQKQRADQALERVQQAIDYVDHYFSVSSDVAHGEVIDDWQQVADFELEELGIHDAIIMPTFGKYRDSHGNDWLVREVAGFDESIFDANNRTKV